MSKFGEGYWNSQMILVNLKEVIILPSGSVYFVIRGKKEWQNSLKKAFAIDALQKSVFFKNWCNVLGKVPQNQGQLLPLPKTGEVFHGTYPKPSLG